MPYELKNRVYVAIYFNGREFPFSEVNTVDFIHLGASVNRSMPHAVLSLTDGSHWLSSNGFTADGTQVSVIVGPGADGTQKTYRFRVASSHTQPSSTQSPVVRIEGLLDAPKFLNSSGTAPIEGSSSSVLSQVAKECGLEYEGVGTSDSQVWYPTGSKMFQFVRDVASCGYATDTSCMMVALDFDGVLRYRDVSSMEASGKSFALKDLEGRNGLPIVSYRPLVESGSANQRSGYGMSYFEQDLVADSLNTRNISIGAGVNDGGDLYVNGDIRSAVGDGTVRHAPIRVGNTSDHAERGRYQNMRGASLFTSTLEVSTLGVTDVHLLDTVHVNAAVAAEADPTARRFEGSYRVLGKIVFVTNAAYAEKLTLSRRTSNETLPGAVAVGSGSSGSRAEAVQPAISSEAPVIAFAASLMTSALSSVSDSVSGVIGALSLRLNSAVSDADSYLSTAPNHTTALNALLSDISSLGAAGVAAINAQWILDPGDTMGQISVIATDYRNQIDAAIADQSPEINRLASRALGVSSAAGGLGGAASRLTAAANPSSTVQGQIGSALAKLCGSNPAASSILADASAATSAVLADKNALVSDINAVAGPLGTAASNLASSASSVGTQITSARSAAFALIADAETP